MDGEPQYDQQPANDGYAYDQGVGQPAEPAPAPQPQPQPQQMVTPPQPHVHTHAHHHAHVHAMGSPTPVGYALTPYGYAPVFAAPPAGTRPWQQPLGQVGQAQTGGGFWALLGIVALVAIASSAAATPKREYGL